MSETLVDSAAIARLSTAAGDFEARLDALLAWEGVSDAEVQRSVNDILCGVRARGDSALVEYSNRFDRLDYNRAIDPTTRARLVEHFRPYNDRLAELTGRDLSAWNR